jgi:hypothetical protein
MKRKKSKLTKINRTLTKREMAILKKRREGVLRVSTLRITVVKVIGVMKRESLCIINLRIREKTFKIESQLEMSLI